MVCAQGRDVLPSVTFHDSDDCLNRSYDLVIASNSLQYEENWRTLLGRLAKASAAWTFLTRVPVTSQHSGFVVLQRAHAYGYATEYIGWVFNRDELLHAAGGAGLKLERELLLGYELTIEGAPDSFTNSGYLFRASER